MKKKCIIMGIDSYGKGAYYKLKKHYNILYYVDDKQLNNQEGMFHNIPIISMTKFIEAFSSSIDIIICSQEYSEIITFLKHIGVTDYYVMKKGFLYHYSKTELLMPYELSTIQYYKKNNREKNILFVKDIADDKTYECATVMRKNGYKVFILYTAVPPEAIGLERGDVFEKVYTVFSFDGLLDFINNSDFDIVHCSGESDYLTALLTLINKPLIHTCKEVDWIDRSMSPEELTVQYLVNTRSKGVMFTTTKDRDSLCRKITI